MISSVERIKPIVKLKFKTKLLKLCLGDYSDAYVLAKRIITFVGTAGNAATIQKDRNNIQKIVYYLLTV